MNICTKEVNGGLLNYVQQNSNLLIFNAPVIIELHCCVDKILSSVYTHWKHL
jgi:hypothetical protein